METTAHIDRLRHRICRLFRDGMHLHADTVAYIDATFAHPGAEALQRRLEAAPDCEAATLLELLFSPDPEVQLALEELLEGVVLTPREADRLAEDIAGCNLRAVFHFPDGRGALRVTVSRPAAGAFVKRLNLTQRLDPLLAAAIGARPDPAECRRIRLKIRNAAFSPGPAASEFLRRLLEASKRMDRRAEALLETALHFLSDASEDTPLYETLMARKRLWLKCLHLGRRQAEMLASGNVETWLAQGRRFPAVDPVQAGRMLNRIDRISLAVFGRTEHYPPDGETVDIGRLESERELTDLLRRLG
jgi:hypothetical protein